MIGIVFVVLEEKAEALQVKMIEGFCSKNCCDGVNVVGVDAIRGDEKKEIDRWLCRLILSHANQ